MLISCILKGDQDQSDQKNYAKHHKPGITPSKMFFKKIVRESTEDQQDREPDKNTDRHNDQRLGKASFLSVSDRIDQPQEGNDEARQKTGKYGFRQRRYIYFRWQLH